MQATLSMNEHVCNALIQLALVLYTYLPRKKVNSYIVVQ